MSNSKNAALLDRQLLAATFFANPYPVFEQLRTTDPVHWCEPWNYWIVSRYADVLACLRRDGRQFSVVGRFGGFLEALPAAARPRFQRIEEHYSAGLLHSDPPDHTRLRNLVNKAFTARVVEQMRPQIEAIVREILAAIESENGFDLIADFAFHLPAIVTAAVVGMPAHERHQFKAWPDDIAAFSAANRLTLEVAENARCSLLAVRSYLLEIATHRRAEPRDDLISRLVGAADQGLSQGELLSTCVTFLVGGHETTTALIGSGLLALFQHPDQLAVLRADPAATPAAIEEFLRFESPNQRIGRLALEDVKIGERHIRRGQHVMLLLGAANRDPEQFPDPDRLDLYRAPNRHLAFAAGPHFCICMPLAQLEAEIAFKTLLHHFLQLHPARKETEWLPSYQLRMLKSLPLFFIEEKN